MFKKNYSVFMSIQKVQIACVGIIYMYISIYVYVYIYGKCTGRYSGSIRFRHWSIFSLNNKEKKNNYQCLKRAKFIADWRYLVSKPCFIQYVNVPFVRSFACSNFQLKYYFHQFRSFEFVYVFWKRHHRTLH